MILKYLIPVKLSIGILPMISLLEKYNLVEVQSASFLADFSFHFQLVFFCILALKTM